MSAIPKRASAIEKKLINSEFTENSFSNAIDLINKEGPGIYIIRACRNFEEGTPNNIKTTMRALSTE